MESKNRLAILLFLAIILFISCNRKQGVVSAEIIPKDSLINIIVDLHLADAILINSVTQSKISDISSNHLYKSVLNKYEITKERFDSSIIFYSENPIVLDSIYDKVIEKLSMIESNGYNDSLMVK